MKKAQIDPNLALVALIVVVIAGLILLFVGSSAISNWWDSLKWEGVGGISGEKYHCDIDLKETTFLDKVIFDSISCQKVGGSCGLFYSIFGQDGRVQAWDSGGKLTSKDYDIGLLGGDYEISMKFCTNDPTATFRVTDDDFNVFDTQEVSLS